MKGTLASFVAVDAGSDADPTRLLMPALGHPDPATRVAIATRLLDDGADAAVVECGNTSVNVLLGQQDHDPDREAPLLQRLLEAGASVNQPSRRGEPPLIQLLQAPTLTDQAMLGLDGVILARPDLDLDARAMPASKTNLETIRERIVSAAGYVRRNLRAMIEAGDTA